MPEHVFPRIINIARLLRWTYHSDVERYRRAQENYDVMLRAGLNESILRISAEAAHDECERLYGELLALCELVCRHLPATAKQCPLVVEAGRWYMHGVDWARAEAELLAIEVDAVQTAVSPKPDPVAVAVAMKASNPEMTIREIATAVGMHYSTLAKKEMWMATVARLKQSSKSSVRRGSKSADGTVEAEDG